MVQRLIHAQGGSRVQSAQSDGSGQYATDRPGSSESSTRQACSANSNGKKEILCPNSNSLYICSDPKPQPSPHRAPAWKSARPVHLRGRRRNTGEDHFTGPAQIRRWPFHSWLGFKFQGHPMRRSRPGNLAAGGPADQSRDYEFEERCHLVPRLAIDAGDGQNSGTDSYSLQKPSCIASGRITIALSPQRRGM